MFKKFGGPTLVEVLVSIAIVGVLMAMLQPGVGVPTPKTDKDLHLDDWHADPQEMVVPPQEFRDPGVNIAGTWADARAWTRFTIAPRRDGRFDVAFLSRTRCGNGGSVELQRVADYRDGVLLLDRPVRELFGMTYDRLFAVRMNHVECLQTAPHVADVKRYAAYDLHYDGTMKRATGNQ